MPQDPQPIRKPDTCRGFRPPIQLGPDILSPARHALRIDGRLDPGPLSPRLHRFLLEWARIRNVHSSARLEGNPLDLDQARRAALHATAETPSEEEIVRLTRAYTRIHEAKRIQPLTIDEILALHHDTFDGVLAGHHRPGQLKDAPNGIIDHTTGLWIFEATPPERTEAELNRLLEWFYGAGQAYDPVVACGVFFAEFQSIHPFHDGNGRIGRLLNMRLLRESGLRNATLAGFDALVYQNRERYYETLRATNRGTLYHVWLRFYAKTLERSYRQAERRRTLDSVADEVTAPSERDLLTWAVGSAPEWFQRNDFPNPNAIASITVSKALAHLHEVGILEREGDRRTTRYRLSNAFLRRLYDDA